MHEVTNHSGTLSLAVLALFSSVACSSTQLDAQKVNDVNATMRAAQEVGAEELPNATLYLHRAEEHLSEARSLAEEGEGKLATFKLNEAKADAELSLQLAKTEKERVRAEEAWARIDEFKEQQQR